MLEYLAYGAIGISMATAILTFRLLTNEQKKDAPNESILKMIKLFMALAVFFAIFFGIVELIKGDGEGETAADLATSIDLIKDKQLETYTLQKNQENQKKVDVVLYYKDEESSAENTAIIGKLNPKVIQEFKAFKSGVDESGNSKWNVQLGDANLGLVSSKWNVLDRKGSKGEWIDVGNWYRLNQSTGQPSDFWFKIEEIRWVTRTDSTGNYKFTVSFGEGESASTIEKCNEECVFYETFNGIINLTILKPLIMKDWKRDYFVAFGAGQPTKSNPNSTLIDRVELYNVYAIQSSLN